MAATGTKKDSARLESDQSKINAPFHTAAHGIIICELGVTKIEGWERELRRNRYR